jgi:hypothetical protein
MSAARKRAERKWFRALSRHANLLEGLEAATRAHPASGRRAPRVMRTRTVVLVPRDGGGSDAA